MRLIDTHCHLDFEPLIGQTQAVLERARESGVVRVLAPSYNKASWRSLPELLACDGVYAAFGLHPWVSHEDLNHDDLRVMLALPKCRAIGETGLDFKIDGCERARQIHVLKLQLDLALELDLPVLLHCRGAFEELLEILQDYSPRLRGTLHAFSRGPELAMRFIDAGLHIAFGGSVTRQNARQARQAARSVPAERLLLETDAPSIGLEGIEPQQVEPAHVRQIADTLADLRGVSPEKIAEITTDNAEKLFNFD